MNSFQIYSFWFVEIAAVYLFVRGFMLARLEGRGRTVEFAMIFVYGIVLEEFDMRFFGTYHYGPHFLLTIGAVPVCIAMLWAVIIAGAMRVSDSLPLPHAARPFMDAFLAVWLDLAIDAVAIRLGYWSWKIPLNEGWFGVPAGNLYAWMWVAFFFSAAARAVRRLEQKNHSWILGYAAVPVVAYTALFLMLMVLGNAGRALGFGSQPGRMVLFAVHLLIFAAVVRANWAPPNNYRQKPVDPFWLRARMFVHCYALFAGTFFGIFRQTPALAAVALAVIMTEFLWMQLQVRTTANA